MANQSNVQIYDANGVKQSIACLPLTWDGVAANMQAMMVVPWNYTLITTTGNTVVKASAGTLAAIVNLSPGGPQPITITGYDNATTNSGPLVANVTNLADKLDWPPGGMAMTAGITINCSAAPSTGGILILWI